jgi:hypothetical protein
MNTPPSRQTMPSIMGPSRWSMPSNPEGRPPTAPSTSPASGGGGGGCASPVNEARPRPRKAASTAPNGAARGCRRRQQLMTKQTVAATGSASVPSVAAVTRWPCWY